MHAEYPPYLDLAHVIEVIGMFDPVDCSMWRMGAQCPNTTDQAALCADSQGRRFVLPQCPLCIGDIQPADVAREQQATNQLLTIFEFSPEYQQRIAMSDILSSLNKSGRADEMKVASALKAYGATKEQTRDGSRWNGLRWRP